MKKLSILLFISFLSFKVFAGEHLLTSESCWAFNKYSSRLYTTELELKYESDFAKSFLLKYDGVYYSLSDENIKSLRSACEKYFEWEEIAVKNGAEITKEIPIRINIAAIWESYTGESCLGGGELYFTFFSQSKTRHQFVISSTKIQDVLGGYSTTTLDDLYFDKEQVKTLYNDISEEKMKSYLETVKKNDDIESLFN